MTKEQKAKWIEALRSGKYKQCQWRLCDGIGGYCCLGVYLHAVEDEEVPNKGLNDDDESYNGPLYSRLRHPCPSHARG